MIRTRIHYEISAQDEGRTVERFLRAQGFSRHLLIQTKYTENGLLLDGMPVHTNVKLKAGQCLSAAIVSGAQNEHMQPVGLPLAIVYEDEDIVVIDKPAGMPVHPSQGHYDDTASNALAYYFAQQDEPFVARSVGRLDRDTSGLVLFARHELSACILAEQMRRREIHREYRAICTGTLPECGVIDAPIARAHGSTIERIVDTEHGDRAVTHYTRLAVKNGFSLAAVRLETGRTHQIRVHMKHIGHPLPGDFLYNPDYSVIQRQALHSYRLAFRHPITGQQMEFTAPIPQDMTNILA
ncbi:RluA family pseudouridine synthase [Butyricicoccus sp.]|uniref:RluA family pseudouridine synthase n=1 Tax=Butyricicoccus sp. TaxID=2049021 RepID=UPI003F14308A